MSAAIIDHGGLIPKATKMSVADAYDAVVALCDPGLSYEIGWIDDDGKLAREFKDGPEAWLIARCGSKRPVVCAILIGRKNPAKLVSELASVKARAHDPLPRDEA